MPNSPVLWGPNNMSIGLQNAEIGANGTLFSYNGPKNYISYGNFESGLTTGWSLGTIGTLTNGLPTGTPTFGSGAAGTLTLGIASTAQLAGTYSLQFVSTAATTAGNMIASQAYAIDTEDQGKMLQLSCTYSTPVGPGIYSGTSGNTLAFAVWDATNSVFLGVAGAFNFAQGTGVGKATALCQMGATTASIRFIVYFPAASAGAYTVNLDSFFLGPQMQVMGPAMTDWVTYTPTIAGFGTPTNVIVYSRRDGGDLLVQGGFSSGTSTATTAQIGIGFGGAAGNVTIDSTKLDTATPTSCGSIAFGSTSTAVFNILAPTSNATYVNIGLMNASNAGTAPAQGSTLAGSGTAITFSFRVPIVGWSSNSAMSADSSQNVVATQVVGVPTGTIASALSSSTTAVFPTVVYDATGSYNSGSYTAPVSGVYRMTAQALISGTFSAGTVATAGIYVNGALSRYNQFVVSGSISSETASVTTSIKLNAGDVVTVRFATAATSPTFGGDSSLDYFVIERLSGPAIITATDRVAMRYNSSTTTVSGTSATILYANKNFDTTGSYATGSGVWTCPATNYYQANASIAVTGTIALNSSVDLQIVQGGSSSQTAESTEYAGGAETGLVATIGDVFYCVQGDTMRVNVVVNGITAPSIVSSTSKNWFSIAKVGGN